MKRRIFKTKHPSYLPQLIGGFSRSGTCWLQNYFVGTALVVWLGISFAFSADIDNQLAPIRSGAAKPTDLKKQGHDFDKWEKEITTFEARDRTNPPPKNAVLFIGSSTIRLWTTLAHDFPEHVVINRGFGGSEIVDSTHFANRILFPYAPKAVFFRAGGNDIAAGRPPEMVFEDFKKFAATVHAKLPEVDIFYISWNPTIARWQNRDKERMLNDRVREYALKMPHIKYIETADIVLDADGRPRPELFRADKLHFSAAGYKLLAERVRPFLPD